VIQWYRLVHCLIKLFDWQLFLIGLLCVCQAEHCRTSLESARTMNTELTEQIEQYAQKLKDVSSSLLFIDYFFA